jgi:soluble lytic murein transglycosylase-like protein
MHDSHAHTVGGRSPEPAPILPSRPYSPTGKPADDPLRKTRTNAAMTSTAWLGRLRTVVRVVAAIAPFMCEVAGAPVLQWSVRAQTMAHSEAVDRFAKFIEEASGRFAVPARWILTVMRVESGRDEHAVSSRGAMGLMQLMPGTWVELSVRYGLGLDPFDAHDHRGCRLPQRHARPLRIGRLPCSLSRGSGAV